jgi:hypothetical protein
LCSREKSIPLTPFLYQRKGKKKEGLAPLFTGYSLEVETARYCHSGGEKVAGED